MNKPCSKCKSKCNYFFEMDTCIKLEKYKAYLNSKRKIISTGKLVTSIEDVLNNEWFISGGQTQHREKLLHLQAKTLLKWIENKHLYIAVRKVESDASD